MALRTPLLKTAKKTQRVENVHNDALYIEKGENKPTFQLKGMLKAGQHKLLLSFSQLLVLLVTELPHQSVEYNMFRVTPLEDTIVEINIFFNFFYTCSLS